MSYFARLTNTYLCGRYGAGNIPDGEFSFPSYLKPARMVWESSPKRFLKLFEENAPYFGGDVGRILMFEVEYRANKRGTPFGFACLFDPTVTELIQRVREKRVRGSSPSGEVSPALERILGCGINFLVDDESRPAWRMMVGTNSYLSSSAALAIANACFKGNAPQVMKEAVLGEQK